MLWKGPILFQLFARPLAPQLFPMPWGLLAFILDGYLLVSWLGKGGPLES